jgi:transposase-like protein
MPRRPVERIPARDFVPPHCPWPECSQHRAAERSPAFRYHRHGSFRRECAPRRVPRYRCLACGRTFSRQSFSTTYYLKRPKLLPWIASLLQASAGHRQIARTLTCAPSTVTRATARLGRHALLLSARALGELGGIREPVVIDHFESFEISQDLPFGVGTAIGHRSWFLYALDPAVHARGGVVTDEQRHRVARRKERERRGGYEGSFRRILDTLAPLGRDGRVVVHTDGHRSYARAWRAHPERARFLVVATPNPERPPAGSPPTDAEREYDSRMLPSNRSHGLIRHTAKHHTRETIAFPRRVNAALERLFLLAVWRNFVKGRSERRPDRRTPAMRLGLTRRPWTWAQVLARRLFPGREAVPAPWMDVYRRDWTTPELPSNTRHRLVHAY